jgi:hypothetical protein
LNESRSDLKLIDAGSDNTHIIAISENSTGDFIAESWLIDHKLRHSSESIRYPGQVTSIPLEANISTHNIKFIYHDQRHSFSVVFFPNPSKSKQSRGQITWKKYNKNGNILFSRTIPEEIANFSQTESTIIFMGHRFVSTWDIRYGTYQQTYQLSTTFDLISAIDVRSFHSQKTSITLLGVNQIARGASKISEIHVDVQNADHGLLIGNLGRMKVIKRKANEIQDGSSAIDNMAEAYRNQLLQVYEEWKNQSIVTKKHELISNLSEEVLMVSFFSLFLPINYSSE